ncbi:MAG: redoxin family protein [Verrucomicrobiota bacterium]
MKPRIFSGVLVLALVSGPALFADEPTVKVGDRAPKIQNGQWIQGDPVTGFDPDKAYIVEFWATWCGPCRVSIPHLNEIYVKYKDKGLVVVGQDCWERDDELVAPFVQKMGDKMTYRVALDDKKTNEKGVMSQTWMAAAGRNGIPSAFLIGKDGRIAWIGHPMELKESVIDDVLAGKFDTDKAAADYARQIQNQARLGALWKDYRAARNEKKWDEAVAKIDEIEKLTPEDQRFELGEPRFNLLLGKKDYEAAFKLAGQLSDAHPENSALGNDLAWTMVSDVTIEKPDLALAEKIATRAVEASKSQNPDILDTLACALFMEGKQDRAIAVEEQAAGLAEGGRKQEYEKTLEGYKKGTNKPDVLHRQAEAFRNEGKLAEAEAALREELALEQKLWETNSARWAATVQILADVLAGEKKTDDAEKLFGTILTPEVVSQTSSADLLRARGQFLARRGRWKDAAADFSRVIALTPDEHLDYLRLATLLVQCNDQDAYQRLCANILTRFGGTTDPMVAERMSKSCLATAYSGVDLAAVSKLAGLAVTKGKDNVYLPYFQLNDGLAEYRQGRFANATELLKAPASQQNPYIRSSANLVLAMAQFQLKQPDEARASLDKAVAVMDSQMPKIDQGEVDNGDWHDWIISRALLREARALIGNPAGLPDQAARATSK